MSIDRLLAIMSRLRDPVTGCPWDREQSFASIAPHTIEEAYEVADAIERANLDDLKSELGDLLFQVVFHAQMASERGAFDFDAVARAICEKLERRHPHVFGTAKIATAQEQNVAWEEHKRKERGERNLAGSALDDVPTSLPALTRAAKLGKRASGVGFDWPTTEGVLDKIQEEVRELRSALQTHSQEEIESELGDLLFAIVNLGRHKHVDPETALRHTNAKFERRFRYVEAQLRTRGKTPQQSSLEEMDALWNAAKQEERAAGDIQSSRPLAPRA